MEDCSITQEQLCEHENKTLEAFVVASRLYPKFDCTVARQNFSFLATAHDSEISFILYAGMTVVLLFCFCFVLSFTP